MKLRGGSLVALSAIVSACAVHVGDGSSSGMARGPSAPAPAPAPAPGPPAPPAPAAVGQPPTPATPATPSVATPSGGSHPAFNAPGTPQPATANVHLHTPPPMNNRGPADATPATPAAATPATKQIQHINPAFFARVDPVNVTFLAAARARQPKLCGPVEVSPGNWVRVDCHMYQPIATAKPHWSARKTKMFTAPTIRIGAAMQPRKVKPLLASAHRVAATGPRMGSGVVSPQDNGGSDFPDVVDHRTSNVEGPIKNQGYVGSCTAFSLSSTIDNAIRRAGKSDVVSPAHIWAHYGMPSMSLAGDANLNKALTTFEAWPYSGKEACRFSSDPNDDCGDSYNHEVTPNTAKSDPALQAKLAKADHDGIQKVVSIEKLATSPFNPDELKTVLASGSDIWFAMYVGSTWMGNSIKDGVIPDWDTMEGGHAITMSGYRKMPDGTHQFLIHNSWGESWADHGYAWVSEASMKKWLKYAYKVKLDTGGAPVAEITDDDCAEDELVDSVTNNCAKMCTDESRPAGGKCPAATGSGIKH